MQLPHNIYILTKPIMLCESYMATELITPNTSYLLDPQYPNLAGINRQERAKLIAQNPKAVRKTARNEWTVKSQASKSVYTVTRDGDNYKCNCPDHILNHCECKHILAVKEILSEKELKPNKTNRDWQSYSLGQISEGEYFDLLLHELAETVPTPVQTGRGRKQRAMSDKIFCAVKKVAEMKSCRRTQASRAEAESNGLIESQGAYNAVNDFLRREDATEILHNLVKLSASPLAELEHHFDVDSSGFKTTQFGDWCDNKHGTTYTSKRGKTMKAKREHNWVKCHICSGELTNIIADVKVTKKDGEGTGDVSNFEELVRGTAERFCIESVKADPAYASKVNFEVVEKIKAESYIGFKKNSTMSSGKAWKNALARFIVDHDNYMEHYNKRNNVESTFSALKAKFNEKLLSKDYTAQMNELLCKVIAYNISVVVSAMYVHGIEGKF